MKTKMNYFFYVALIAIFIISSCSKEDEKPAASVTEAVASAVDDNTSEAAYDNLYSEVDETAAEMDEANSWDNTTKTKSLALGGTKQITVQVGQGDTTVWPKTITVVFTDWVIRENYVINGTITMTQTNRMMVVNAERSIDVDITIDDTIKIEGVKTVTNLGLVEGKPTVRVTLADGQITNLVTEKAITRAFDHIRTWEAGFGRASRFVFADDIWSVTGTATGTNRFGHKYTNTIKEKLVFKAICPFIVNGKLEIVIDGKQPFTIDYGYPTANACDRRFKVIVGGEERNIGDDVVQ